jgi:hypothetical protein
MTSSTMTRCSMTGLVLIAALASTLATGLVASATPQLPDPLPRPDGKSADTSKAVQVYILMGQSNMLGFGKPSGLADACKNKGLYPYLVEENGDWTVRKDVRFVRVMCSGNGASKTYNNEWMTIKGNIGPEMGIGHYVGHVTKAPVLILKSCIGNRSLGYDLLPPSAEGYEGNRKGPRKPKSGGWYAGVQYDGDVAAAKKVLSQLGKHYPGGKRYEVAGFFWWQGDKDFRNAEHAEKYEKHLLCLIESLRTDLNAPNAKFVCATLGQTRKNAGGPQGKILEATLNIDGQRGKYKAHKGKVASVYSNPLSMGGSSSGHYGGNAETYMNIGQAMGKAMAKLIMNSAPGIPGVEADQLEGSLKSIYNSILAGKLGRADKAIRAYLDAGDKDGEQMIHAMKLNEHAARLVDSFVGDLEQWSQEGDCCELRDALAKNGKGYVGIAAFDRKREAWSAQLATEKAIAEMVVGDELKSIVARKKRSSQGAYFALLVAFQEAHPDSFYEAKAEQEVAPIRAALRQTLQEIAAFDDLGDMHSKFEAIRSAKSKFAKIPEFDQASKRWATEAKDPAVKKSIAAGTAYAAVFVELSKLDDRLAKTQAKNKKITGKNKRTKAEQKATANYEKKLKSLASKLEKLAVKNSGTYYGDAAAKSHKAYVDSKGKKLADGR